MAILFVWMAGVRWDGLGATQKARRKVGRSPRARFGRHALQALNLEAEGKKSSKRSESVGKKQEGGF